MYHKFLMDVREHCSARQHLMEYFSSCDIKIPLSEITKQTCAFGTARRYERELTGIYFLLGYFIVF